MNLIVLTRIRRISLKFKIIQSDGIEWTQLNSMETLVFIKSQGYYCNSMLFSLEFNEVRYNSLEFNGIQWNNQYSLDQPISFNEIQFNSTEFKRIHWNLI